MAQEILNNETPEIMQDRVPSKEIPSGTYTLLALVILSAVTLGSHYVMIQGILITSVSCAIFLIIRGNNWFYKPPRSEQLFLCALFAVFIVSMAGMLPLPIWLVNIISPFTRMPWKTDASAGWGTVSVLPETSYETLLLCSACFFAYMWGRTHLSPAPAQFVRLFFYAASLVAIIALALYAFGLEPMNLIMGWLPGGRLRGFYSNENRFAVWLSMALITGIAWYLDKSRPEKENIPCVAGISILFISIVLTASRGAFIGLTAAFLLMMAVLYKRWRFNKRALILLILMPGRYISGIVGT